MIALNDAETGKDYLVTWIMGRTGSLLRNEFDLKENTLIHVTRHFQDGGVIISFGDKRLAICKDVAYSVKLEPFAA